MPRGGSRAQAISTGSSSQVGTGVERAWESRAEEALVPSKNLQARGCEVWAEREVDAAEGRASGKKYKLLLIRKVPPSNAQLLPRRPLDQLVLQIISFSGSAWCSREVSVRIHSPP